MNPNKPYRELELAAIFMTDANRAIAATNPDASILLDGRLLVIPVSALEDGDALAAIRDHLFAECFIPHHEEAAAYGLTFHLLNKLNHQIAIYEIPVLQQVAPEIVERYRHHCQPFPEVAQ